MGWIRTEHFHEEAASGDFLDGLLDPLFFNMTLDVDEKNVFPGFAPLGARLDLGHAQPMRREGTQ